MAYCRPARNKIALIACFTTMKSNQMMDPDDRSPLPSTLDRRSTMQVRKCSCFYIAVRIPAKLFKPIQPTILTTMISPTPGELSCLRADLLREP